jgi:aminopeptidase N
MNRAIELALSLVMIATLSGCKSNEKKERDPAAIGQPTVKSEADLTLKEAQSRKARLSNIEYKLHVTLPAAESTFKGVEQIRFTLSDSSKPLRLDFFEGKVESLTVNGQSLGPEAKLRYSIELPAQALKSGANTVDIKFTQNYSSQGQGLHKFTDPQTKEVFLYSQFEAYDANRFMPCFDQPDLRATFTLTVDAPAKWEVISTTRETKIKKGIEGMRTWEFPESEAIATYLFSLHAGPYKVWKDQFEKIPLRLFARPSQAKYVRVKEWFKWTKQGLKFYNNYFAYPYPFKKYDQLAVPEFNAGAMENVGAVTFSERFLWRSTPTRDDLRGLSGVILHEMAHMWFGDVVTMKWWNDLWLNESFATFMSTLAQHEATEFKEVWQEFFTGDKSWAYWEDSLITTHPIETTVDSVKVAFANFDGITYGKGAAVLKQLREYIGAEAFKKGIQTYIKTYAFKNAELKEFIGALQTETKRDLALWSERWLRQSGTDKIAAKWTCDEKTPLESLELIVTPSPGASFRPQEMEVGLFTMEKKFAVSGTIPADIQKPQTTLQGKWTCPQFVYPNFNDAGYVAVSLDHRSLEFTKEKLSSVTDSLLRSQLWANLWQMVRNTEMPLRDYVQVLLTHFPKENDALITRQVAMTVTGRRNSENASVLNYWPLDNEAEKTEFISKMEDEYLRRFLQAKSGSDDQRDWFDYYVQLARTPKALAQLTEWAKKNPKNVAKGMPFDLDRKWDVARTLARYKQPVPEKFMNDLKKADTSDRGVRNAMAVEAIAPDPKVKEKWVTILRADKPSVTFIEARTVLRSLFPTEQNNLARRFEDDFYAYLNKNARSENEIFVEGVAKAMTPLNCSSEQSTRMRDFLKNSERFSPGVAKAMKIGLDEDERCQRVRAMSRL